MDNNLLVRIDDEFSLDYGRNQRNLCGIPFLRIQQLNISIQYLPVTKTQFEYFLCERQDPDFDEGQYLNILEYSPRISPRKINPENYEQTFITALTFKQMDKFRERLGESYDYLKVEEWNEIVKFLNNHPINDQVLKAILEQQGIPKRSKEILSKLQEIVLQKGGSNLTMANQLLLRKGINEWIRDPDSSSLYSFMKEIGRDSRSVEKVPLRTLEIGVPNIGFRLIKR